MINGFFRNKTQRFIAITIIIGLIGTAGITLYLTKPIPNISLSEFNKIKIGMHRKVVRKIIGCCPGDYQTKPKKIGFTKFLVPYCEEEWWTDDHYFIVIFNNQGRVVDKGYLDISNRPFTPTNQNNIFDMVANFFHQVYRIFCFH